MTPPSPLSLSVVLPVFLRNADGSSVRLLRRALESVLDQTYPDAFEILVVDDGSPVPVRDTMQGAGMPESPAVRWLRTDRNNGLVHALNIGIREARYELIARLDADDRWLPGKIAAQTSRFTEDPDLSLVATGMTVVDAEGLELEQHLRRDGWENILQLAAERGWCPFPHGSVVALTSVYRLLGGYSYEPAYRHCEDYHLWSNWIRFFKPAMVESILYEYRQTRGSISDVHHPQQSSATQQIHQRLATVVDWKTHPENIGKLADILNVSLLQCGAVCYRMWKFKPRVWMPEAAVDVLRCVLPDLDITIGYDGPSPIWRIEDVIDGFPGLAGKRIAGDDVVVCAEAD